MTNELVIVYSRGNDGVVLIKDRMYHNWKKKDLKKAAKRGFIAGYNKAEPDAYFVIPTCNVDCLTICEGDIHNDCCTDGYTDDCMDDCMDDCVRDMRSIEVKDNYGKNMYG